MKTQRWNSFIWIDQNTLKFGCNVKTSYLDSINLKNISWTCQTLTIHSSTLNSQSFIKFKHLYTSFHQSITHNQSLYKQHWLNAFNIVLHNTFTTLHNQIFTNSTKMICKGAWWWRWRMDWQNTPQAHQGLYHINLHPSS